MFDRKQMFFIDGEELLTDPGEVFEEVITLLVYSSAPSERE